MKTSILIALILILFLSCDSKKEQKVVLTNDFPEEVLNDTISNFHCYQFSNGKDTIQIQYQQEGLEIEGWMRYNFFEKDGSVGEIEGIMTGDTLKLEYDFLSEGMLSEQQVYFLKKDGKLYRGFGEMKMSKDSVMNYVQTNQLNFEDTTPMEHLENCPNDFIQSKNIDFYKKEKEKLD